MKGRLEKRGRKEKRKKINDGGSGGGHVGGDRDHLLCSKVMIGKLFPVISAIARPSTFSLPSAGAPRNNLRAVRRDLRTFPLVSSQSSHLRFIREEDMVFAMASRARVESGRQHARLFLLSPRSDRNGCYIYYSGQCCLRSSLSISVRSGGKQAE